MFPFTPKCYGVPKCSGVLLYSHSLLISFIFHCFIFDLIYSVITPGNVVRGNQNYANEILTGASGHELQTVDRMSIILLPRYLLISKREKKQLGNVVLNSFHFCTRLVIEIRGKIKLSSFNLFSCLGQIYPTTPCSG